MLTLALCLVGVGGAKAQTKTLLSDLKAANGTDADWQNAIPKSYPLDVKDATLFGSDASTQATNANINNYDYIYFEVTDFVSARAVRVFFWDPTNNVRIDYFLKPVAEKETANYSANTTITGNGTYCVRIPVGSRLQGAKTPWTSTGATDPYFKFSEIYLTERPETYIDASEVFEAPTGTTDVKNLTGTESNWLKISYPATLGDATVLGGNGNGGDQSTHVTITDYDYINFHINNVSASTNFVLRVWVWDDINNQVVTLYPHPIADCADVTDWKTLNKITSAGDYAVKVSEYKYLKGVKSLAYWQGSAGTITIGEAYMSTGSPVAYLPTGKYSLAGDIAGSPSLTAALEDANAIYYDATGVTGTGVNLVPTNPNAIFKAEAGALANTKNVMIGTTIANLDLTDGHPFAAPAGATATAATYTRTMSNQFGTICLPYAVSSNDAVKYYTLGALSGDVLTLTAVDNLAAGTPAIVEKVSGSSITAAGSGALAGVQVPGAGTLQLFGTFEVKTILASDHEGKSIYAIANNQFVQATNSINLPAFRAYFVSTPASANIRFGFDEGEDATAINALTGEGDVTIESIYSADGAQQSSLQKGMNVVKMSNGEVKKILVK